MVDYPHRFEVYWVDFDPVQGSEIAKTRPAVIISPDESNQFLSTVIVAPLTSTKKGYPTRLAVKVEGKSGEVVCDQMRAIDKSRLVKQMAVLTSVQQKDLCDLLKEMFGR